MKFFKIFMLVFFATTLIACGGAEERKSVYMEKAKASIEAGDLDKARIELKNVLQIDPKDAEAYYQLGKVFEQKKDYRKAFANYKKAEELDPELLDNQARLGRIYLFLIRDTGKAQEKVDYILSKEPGNIEGLYLKAAIAVRNNDEKIAIEITEGIVSKQPDNVDAVTFLVALYEKNQRTDDAISILETALQKDKANIKINKLLGLILVRSKNYSRAETIYKTLLENQPDNRESYKILAAFYNVSDNKEKAETVLRQSIANDPEDPGRYFDFLKFISVTKGNEEAINELRGFIAEKKYIGKLRIALGEYLYVNNKRDEAIDVYKKAIRDFPDEKTGVDARIALASIYINSKDLVRASEVIDEAVLVSPNDPTINLFIAKIALHNKDAEKAIIALRIVNKVMPENIEAYALLSKAYRLNGDAEQASNILISAYENNRTNPGALIELAQLYMSKDIDMAEKIIDEYNKLKDSDYKGLSIKAAILNKKKKFKEANIIAEKLIEKYPNKDNGYIQSVPYYNDKGEKQKVFSILEEGYLTVKDNRKLLMLLSSLQVADKKFDVVEKRIKAELESSPDDAVLIALLAKVYLFNDNAKEAISLLKGIVDSKTVLEEPYLLLAKIYSKKKDIDAVTEVLKEGVENVSSSLKIPFQLAMIYEFNDKYKKAIEVYRKLYDLHPDNLVVVNNLVSLLVDHSEDEFDLDFAKSMVVVLEENENEVFSDTIGWVYYKLGNYKNAIQYLTKAIEKSPKVNIFNYHLGMAYKMSGDKAQAKLYLEKSLSDGKDFKEKDQAKAALKDL